MTLAGFFSWASGFDSYLVKNSENRFACDEVPPTLDNTGMYDMHRIIPIPNETKSILKDFRLIKYRCRQKS